MSNWPSPPACRPNWTVQGLRAPGLGIDSFWQTAIRRSLTDVCLIFCNILLCSVPFYSFPFCYVLLFAALLYSHSMLFDFALVCYSLSYSTISCNIPIQQYIISYVIVQSVFSGLILSFHISTGHTISHHVSKGAPLLNGLVCACINSIARTKALDESEHGCEAQCPKRITTSIRFRVMQLINNCLPKETNFRKMIPATSVLYTFDTTYLKDQMALTRAYGPYALI